MVERIKSKIQIEKGLFFDELDEFIIRQIVLCYKEKRELDTWHLSKLYVSTFYSKKIEDIYSYKKPEVDSIYRKIKKRIDKYKKYDIITSSKNGGGKEVFDFDMETVTVAKHKFSDGYKECLILRL